jgi:cyclic pyranopterin monophosphate synthase
VGCVRVPKLSHLDRSGAARMVDVSAKPRTRRRAIAAAEVRFNAKAYAALRDARLAKGDAITVARLAGIQAAKRTSEWIPLCHTLPLDSVTVEIELVDSERVARVTSEARTRASTGVEMEALVAASAACLALYDMTKALDRAIEITGPRLELKEGGRSGRYRRSARSTRGRPHRRAPR